MVTMHYRGTLQSDGKEFDSSYARNKPFSFKIGVGKVIQGWDLLIMKMSLGEKAILFIGSDYAYGTSGNGPIPPGADLKFEVELLKIERAIVRDSKRHDEYEKVAKQMLGQAGHHAGEQ